MSDKRYWLGFHLVSGIGASRAGQLTDYFGSLSDAWSAPTDELRRAGLHGRAINSLLQTRERLSLDAEMEKVEQAGISILTLADDGYPRLLREIGSPPLVLYVRGELTHQDEHALAVVGTRRATSYGREAVRRLTAGIAAAGITIVSGLARGIDAIAHQTALESGGRTIAVLGSGADVIYPPEHRKLAEQVAAQGAIVSEFPLGTQPDRTNFPIRNRLISGLSLGTLVIEAGIKSGALITTRFAADQGRTVFAVPGPILSGNMEGNHQLLRDGATLAARAEDVLEELDLPARRETLAARQLLPSSGEEGELMQQLSAEPRHIDEVALDLGMNISHLSALLLELQLKGLVRNVGGQHYVRA